jgi:hypothetical protein
VTRMWVLGILALCAAVYVLLEIQAYQAMHGEDEEDGE